MILDRYIARTVIFATLFVSAIVLGIQGFLSLVQQITYVGRHGYTFLEAVWYALIQLPAQFYQLFPMAGFLGVMIALSRLSLSSQLIVMRASGVSILRITQSVMKAAVLLILIMTLLGEGIGPILQQHAQRATERILYPPHDDAMLHAIWLHHGDTFTYIDTLRDQETLQDVARYHFSSDGQLIRATAADKGQWVDGKWRLRDLKQTIFGVEEIEGATENESGLYFAFQPMLQVQMAVLSAQQTLPALYRTIRYRESIGLSVSQYLFTWWQRLFQPITTLIMMLLAVPFVFGALRGSSMSMRMMVGIFISFAFYMMNQLFGPITMVYQVPPILSALIPPSIFLFVTLSLLTRIK